MYGLISKILAIQGERDRLIDILLKGGRGMPGCLSYIAAKDLANSEAIWVTEVWESLDSHQASLGLKSVQEAITQGRPLIAEIVERHETEPVTG